ncbi:MAG: EAL domain-containing protein [Thermoleophilaceae bacterium]
MEARQTQHEAEAPAARSGMPAGWETRDHVSGLFELSLDLLCVADLEGYFTCVNPSWERVLGWTRDELVSVPYTDYVHPDDLEATLRQASRLTEPGHRLVSFENRYRAKSGEWKWLAWTAQTSPEGDAIYAVAREATDDVIEREERERKLKREVDALRWVGRIQEAIDEEGLLIYSQPVVDLASGAAASEELLVRMPSRNGGPAHSAGEFLTIAEQYGLVQAIDEWVTGQAVQVAAAERALGVNLSSLTISNPASVKRIEQCVVDSGIDPCCLTFEVTETAVMDNPLATRRLGERLTDLGCHLALDDFGAGFGSFVYLRNLPADCLKIDTQFVRGLKDSDDDQRVVSSIVHLAQQFDKTTVAEGVEDEESLQLLRELGVDRAQGYLLGRPAPLAV